MVTKSKERKKILTRIPSTGKNGRISKSQLKSILISQPRPETEKNPYADLSKKHRVTFEFRPFIHLEGIAAKEFRKQKINPAEFSSVIISSRNAIDQFFKLCDDLRVRMSPDAKYYCMTEAIALYLQKYILYRKRKVFYGDGTFQGLTEIIEKHRDGDRYLILCADIHKSDISDYLKSKKYLCAEGIIFKTVPVELTEREIKQYNMLVFFTPAGVSSFLQNFRRYKQGSTVIGAFGTQTMQAVIDAGLRVDLQAPAPGIPSMSMAIDSYLSAL